MVVWLLAAVAMGQPCPDRDVLIDGLRDAVNDRLADEADELQDELLAAFGCGGRAQSGQLVGLWLALAARSDQRDELDEANVALRAARRLGDAFDDAYGPALQRRWQDANTNPILPSRLAVDASQETYPLLLVDGLRFQPPGLIEAGLHLVQWGNTEDDLTGARIVRTKADAITTIDVPYGGAENAVASLRPAPEPKPPRERRERPERTPKPTRTDRRSPAFLVVAGVTGAAALVTAGLTAATDPDPANLDAQPEVALGQRFDRQRALGLTSFGLMAASTVSLGIHIVQ
ncbi:MAG: hypothetical protein AAGA48_25155 [Myxococcota bacterium]